MDNCVKKILAIHDLSAFGRCALSVILPLASSMGVQVVAVPTAVLSAHFGAIKKPSIVDLTDFLATTRDDYLGAQFSFDCVYTGYLGSPEQVAHCLRYMEDYGDALHVVDPVMGDHGKPYSSCTKALQSEMKKLVKKADIITPNLTEVCILLGEEYPQFITREKAKEFMEALSQLGPKQVVITGLHLNEGVLTNMGYDAELERSFEVDAKKVDASYPGTGDCFGAIMTAGLTKGYSLEKSVKVASDYLEKTIALTKEAGTDPSYGILFEKTLHLLVENERVFYKQ